MKEKLIIVNIMFLDENSVELTCNSLLTEKSAFNLNQVISGDVRHIRRKMVQASPKVFKVVVSMDFYKNHNLNILKYIELEIKA